MPNPMARNTLRLLREADQGQPEKEQRHVQKRLHESRMDGHADVGAEVETAVAKAGNQLPSRGEMAKRLTAVGTKLLKRHAADEKTLVRLEPGGVARA